MRGRHPVCASKQDPSLGFCVFVCLWCLFFLQSHKTPWVPLCFYDLVLLIYLTLCILTELWKPPLISSRPTPFTHILPYHPP